MNDFLKVGGCREAGGGGNGVTQQDVTGLIDFWIYGLAHSLALVIKVGGVVAHETHHGVGHEGAEGYGMTLGRPPDGGEEGVDYPPGEVEGQEATAAEIVELPEIGIEAFVQQGDDVVFVLVQGGKGGKGGEVTVGETGRVELVEKLFVCQIVILIEHGAYALGHAFFEVVLEESAADLVAGAFVAEEVAGGETFARNGLAVVVAEVAARAEYAHHALVRAAKGATGTQQVAPAIALGMKENV